MVLEYEIIYSEITGIQFSGIVLKEGIWCVAKGCLWDKHVFAGDFDGYFLPFVGKQGIFITFYVVTGVFKILGVNRNIISKEANEVSERLGKESSNPKLLGAWEALTSVMKASALFDEYNDLRT